MKTAITPAYTFTPSAGTLDLSAITGFSIKKLYAVLNTTRGAILFAQGSPLYGISALNGSVLTFTVTTTAMSSADNLTIIYDVIGSNVAASSSSVTLASDDTTALATGTIADTAWSGTGNSSVIAALKSIYNKLAGVLSVNQLGALGTDHSVNQPTIGNILATGTATKYFTAQNQSAATIQLILDDGASATPTILLLAPGSGANAQGGSSDQFLFAGRVRLAGTAGSQVALRVW